MTAFSSSVLLAFALFCVAITLQDHAEEEADCSTSECPGDPCREVNCPRFPNAKCEVDKCSCRAEFRHRKHHHIISNCSMKTCGEKNCRGNRICVHQLVPSSSSCPNGSEDCQQMMIAHCKHPFLRASCDGFTCPEGNSCVVTSTAHRGPVAKCHRTHRPQNCAELGQCPQGKECRVKEREGKDPVAHCVVMKTAPSSRKD